MHSSSDRKMDLSQVMDHFKDRPHLIAIILLAAVFTNFVTAFDLNLFFFSSPFILDTISAPDIYLGLSASAFTLGVIIFAAVGGMLFSRFSLKYLLVVSILVMTVGSVLTGYVSNPAELLLMRFIFGAGNGVMQSVITGFLGGIYPTRRGFLLSLKGITFSAGMLFGPYAESLVVPAYRIIYLVTGGVGAASILLILLFLPNVFAHREKDRNFRFRRLFNWNTSLTFISIFFFGIGLFGFLGYFSHYMISYLHVESGTAAIISSMLGIGGLVLTMPLGHLSDIWNRKMTLVLIFGMLVIASTGVFLGHPGIPELMILSFLFGGGYNGMINVISAASQKYGDIRDIGLVSGTVFSFYSGGGILGGILFGEILHIVGFSMSGILFVSVVMTIGLITTLLIREPRHQKAVSSQPSL
jgi:MFS family permease